MPSITRSSVLGFRWRALSELRWFSPASVPTAPCYPAFRALVRLTDYLVDGVVVNCEEVRRHLVMDERVNPRLIHLCYNGIDTSGFRCCPGAARRARIL